MPAERTNIAWTNSTWNPVTGCTQVSPGCAHCYAKALTERWGRNFETVVLHPDRLEQPLHWKKARRIFVNSMSDLFHEDIPDEFIDQIFEVMARSPQHTYQVLTKRPARMREYIGSLDEHLWRLPLPNVWLGVSVENQHFANERIGWLGQTPAAVRWVSYEPALSKVDFSPFLAVHWIDWLVCGGESGPDRRPFNVAWAQSAYEQCKVAHIPFFMKQDGAYRSEQQGRIPNALWAVKEYPC